jgi:hypothetical protein
MYNKDHCFVLKADFNDKRLLTMGRLLSKLVTISLYSALKGDFI